MVQNQGRIQDFPEEGVPTPQGGRQHTILPNFPKNSMKLKELGPPGGRVPRPLRSANAESRADPGFPRQGRVGGGAILKFGLKTYYLIRFLL